MVYTATRAFSPAPGVSVPEGGAVDWTESAARYYLARGWLRPEASPPPAPPSRPVDGARAAEAAPDAPAVPAAPRRGRRARKDG